MFTGNVTFAVFSDLHVDIMPDAVPRMQVLLRRAREEKADFLLHLGDIMYPEADFLRSFAPQSAARRAGWFQCERDDEKREIRRMIQENGLPLFGVLGNHDMDACSKETACRYLGLPAPHYTFDAGGVRFIALDTNYILEDGRYVDFDHCNYSRFKTRETSWLGPAQRAWLEEQLLSSPYPCVLLSHAPLGDELLNAHDGAAVWEIVRRTNRGRRRVILALNGHNHVDGVCARAGVPFLSVNSISNIWIGHEYDCVRYSETISRLYPHLKGCAPYWDALFAIVRIDGEGIHVQGRESSYVGPSPYELGFPRAASYHVSTPCIRSRTLPITEMPDEGILPC